MNIWLKFNQFARAFALPQQCLLCGAACKSASYITQQALGEMRILGLCAPCLASLPWHQAPQCPQCALPTHQGMVCGDCLNAPPAFDATYAIFKYAYPVDSMIQRYKYNAQLALGNLFAAIICQKMWALRTQNTLPSMRLPDVMIPMPLHPTRLKERGFNQSLEIAKVISKNTGLPIDIASVKRIKLTPPQAALAHKERVKNMHGAFACTADFTGKHVLLIDDVMTTGSSLYALANTLKKAGAKRVECQVVARTL